MSNLKISSNLFLGKQEIDFLKSSLKDQGYVKLFQNAVTSYGVVKSVTDANFTNLQVYNSSIGKIGIRAGVAIDANLNVIEIKEDLIDQFTIPTDSTTKYVIISHQVTVIEEGTINIEADGSILGTGTAFIGRLRGLPNFPSKISFESTINDQEYIVQAVQSDTLASLNVSGSTLTPENDVKYKVVGTFTPSVAIPSNDKFPFESDGYLIELRDDNILAPNEYILADVIFNGIELSIFDKRLTNKFSLLDESTEVITDDNPVVGVEQIMYDSTRSTMHENLVKVGWGVESISGNWSINSSTQELTVSSGQGGAWGGLAPFADGDFDKWYVVFEKTGQVIQVQESIKVGTAVSLKLDFSNTYPIDGNVSITPNSDHVEVTVINIGNPTADKRLTFASMSRHAIIKLEAGTTSILQYRHISRDQISLGRTINNGSYIKEPSFDASGLQVSQGVQNYFDGNITPLLSSTNLYDKLTCNYIKIWHGGVDNIPDDHFICDGENGTPDLRGQFLVGKDPREASTYAKQEGETGGAKDVTLTENQLAAHTHTGEATGFDHTHDYKDRYFPVENLNQAVGSGFGVESQAGGLQGSGDDDADNVLIIYKEAKTETSGELTGTLTTQSSGGGEAHENLPPYYTVCFIMRPCGVTPVNEVQGNILDLSTLLHFKNDAAAALGGISVGSFYLADKVNTLGLAYGTVKRREA